MSAKEVGEELAGIAASSGIGSKQLRSLLTRSQTSTLDWLEASIKYQIGRKIRGFREFGEALLNVVRQHKDDKAFVTEALTYVCLTVDYCRDKIIRDLQPQIESTVKDECRSFGYQRIELSTDEGVRVNTYLSNFRGNPRILSERIKQQLLRNIPQLQNKNLEVWINPRWR